LGHDILKVLTGLAGRAGAREVSVKSYFNLNAMAKAVAADKTQLVQAAVDGLKLEENKAFCDNVGNHACAFRVRNQMSVAEGNPGTWLGFIATTKTTRTLSLMEGLV